MKKLFTSFLAAGTVASFAACAKKEVKPTTTETKEKETKETTTKTTTVAKGSVQKGTFKIGVNGQNTGVTKEGKELKKVVELYSQDIKDPKNKTGTEYFKLPSGLFLKTADAWSVSGADASTKLEDKTKMAASNLDAIFIAVTDSKQNSSDVYKAVVEKKEFGATKLFFIGEKAKAQEGAPSKLFAGGNVSTASFNEYAATYIAGFQSAVGAIKFSDSEDSMQETSVSFLIGATSDIKERRKAFAFRRGVEAAAAHASYSKYLKVKFVSKTEDSSKSSKRLYREISDWKSIDESKSKLYEFSSSDTFSDGDRKVVYIAGTKASDWTGLSTDSSAAGTWVAGNDTGLIGSLYNTPKPATGKLTTSALSSKTFGGSGVWIVLDKDTSAQASTKNSLVGKPGNTSTEDDFERRQVKFMGWVGQESSGTEAYAKAALKGLYMGGPSYMIGKHTIFGSELELEERKLTTVGSESIFKLDISGTKITMTVDKYDGKTPWVYKDGATGKDSDGKAKDRFADSFAKATEKELTEAELIKESPWIK